MTSFRYPTMGPHTRDLTDMQRSIAALSDVTERGKIKERQVTVKDQDLGAGYENIVEHGLGRDVEGWVVVDTSAPALVWRILNPTTSGVDTRKHLVLCSTANTTVSIEVF